VHLYYCVTPTSCKPSSPWRSPPRPGPGNGAAFLDRLDALWLKNAWSDGRHPAEGALVQAAAKHLPDIQLRFATLLDRLGPALDGPGNLADAEQPLGPLRGVR
jgi:hypothetical protein